MHVLQIQSGARDVVLGLSDVHPEALQNHPVDLFVGRHHREDLALDGRRLGLWLSGSKERTGIRRITELLKM